MILIRDSDVFVLKMNAGASISRDRASSSWSLLPSDPNDKYYLTHCYACQALAKPDQEFIRNYGGLVCFSCRAFWRRAHQVGNETKNQRPHSKDRLEFYDSEMQEPRFLLQTRRKLFHEYQSETEMSEVSLPEVQSCR